ncbi:MAG: hypothetical protein D6800_08855 [Candidatus Zixiibacteriota bacterium]|nr:MAG: hypothetical protein D6800_08855 [candidate division Zixibacteria bacterium]
MKRLLTYGFFLLLFPAASQATEFIASRGEGLARTVTLSYPTASTLVNLPVADLSSGSWSIETGYNRLFELSDLDQVFVAAAGRWRKVSVAFGLSQFGTSGLYTEKLMKGSLGIHLRQFAFGMTASGELVEIGNNYGTLRAAGLGLSAAYHWQRLRVALMADDLNSPSLHENSLDTKPRWNGYVEFRGEQSFLLTGRVLLQRDQTAQFAFAQWLNLSSHAAFYWGIQTSPLRYGAGIELEFRKMRFTYATSVHPTLGFTHTVALSVGVGMHHQQRAGFE